MSELHANRMDESAIGSVRQRVAMQGVTLFSLMLMVGLLLTPGCVSPPAPQPAPPVSPPAAPSNATTAPTTAPNATSSCADKTCFIQVANNCQNLNMTLNEEVGTIRYSSSKDCVFTKTIVRPNEEETSEMKNLLQDQSLTCHYQKNHFDSRWITSLIAGLENCDGKLKDTLSQLLLFTS